ncbi:MAG: ferritin-like domain-containing protein [bacterium]
MRLENLRQLYVHELRDLHSAKKQMLDRLPRMEQAASDEALKSMLGEHRNTTREHVEGLKRLFQDLGEEPEGKVCRGMAGLVRECDEMMEADADDQVKDAGLIANAQRMEHYELAGFGAVRTYARMLGDSGAEQTLQGILDHDGGMNKQLTELAHSHVNPQVRQPS